MNRGAATTPKVVVLGMMSRIPVPGVIWQTAHYLVGLERLGFEVYYVEDHGMTPKSFFGAPDDDGWARAAAFVDVTMRRFGLGGRWAVRAEFGGNRYFGMSERELTALYRNAALLMNLHGSNLPRPEHRATGRLVLVETDPVELQVKLAAGDEEAIDYAAAHVAHFTFGESYGRPGCKVPTNPRFDFVPTRQPVVLDWWPATGPAPSGTFTTVGNWHQHHREVTVDGVTYHWSKDREFARILGVPARTGARVELALGSCDAEGRDLLVTHGWHVRPPFLSFEDLDAYRDYITASQGELTVAKEQNVVLGSGWFSDRSATYLAAGRPVVTQDTGFGDHLPTGKGLLSFTTEDQAVAAVEEVLGNPRLHEREARAIAREHFDADRVLTDLLDHVGLRPSPRSEGRSGPSPRSEGRRSGPSPRSEGRSGPSPRSEGRSGPSPRSEGRRSGPGRRRPTPPPSGSAGLPAHLDVSVHGRWPTTILDTTIEHAKRTIDARVAAASDQDPGPRPEGVPDATVVVVAHDAVEVSALCLESVLAASGATSFELVVVDNGSTDLTPELVSALAWLDGRVRPVRLEDNGGFAAGVNAGLLDVVAPTVVLLNSDTIVTDGWLDRLLAHLDDPGVGMVGPVTNHACNEAQIPTTYRTVGEMRDLDAERARAFPGRSRPLPMLAMFCVAAPRSVLDEVGPLDEGFGLGLFEDDDYSARVRAAGYELRCAEDVFVHHFGEVSLGRVLAGDRYLELFDGNRERFESKWGRPWQPHGRRPDAVYEALRAVALAESDALLPTGATALVVSKGDDAFLDFPSGRPGGHFPGTSAGAFLGEYPADSAAAIDVLAAQRKAGARFLVVPASGSWWLDHYAGMRDHLAHELGGLVHRSDACSVWDLDAAPQPVEVALRTVVASQADRLARLDEELSALRAHVFGTGPDAPRADATAPTPAPPALPSPAPTPVSTSADLLSKDAWSAVGAIADELGVSAHNRYLLLRARLRAALVELIPLGSTVAVVSHGDDVVLGLAGRRGWHFPRLADGEWAGAAPAGDAEAIRHLEVLAALGADHLVIPATSAWWRDYYRGLFAHLATSATALDLDPALGWAWRLDGDPAAADGTVPVGAAVGIVHAAVGHGPTVCDWDSGLGLAALLPELAVFSPPFAGDTLPYLTATADVVVVGAGLEHRREEARRVAGVAVIECRPSGPERPSERGGGPERPPERRDRSASLDRACDLAWCGPPPPDSGPATVVPWPSDGNDVLGTGPLAAASAPDDVLLLLTDGAAPLRGWEEHMTQLLARSRATAVVGSFQPGWAPAAVGPWPPLAAVAVRRTDLMAALSATGLSDDVPTLSELAERLRENGRTVVETPTGVAACLREEA